MQARQKIQPDWWMKSFAGTVLGFSLAIMVVGIFAWWGPNGLESTIKPQFNMWMVTPIWMLVLSSVFLFRTGWRALSWLLFANLIVGSLLMLAKHGGAN